ncbi:ester cyclase [Herbaspirillum sp. NPDC101397]|uniref:ester cyclase n=1 Tax=Herbaspirillum sp. NPDC101397 TaxID=3364006 RepID=UPI00383A5438
MHNRKWQSALTLALAAGGFGGISSDATAEASLPAPQHVAIDTSPASTDTDARVLAARRYAAFWNTGDAQFARQALSPAFVDRTLPAGRPQGVNGPLQASEGFRKAVPDLSAEVQDMTVAGDRVAVHLRFRGHFTGVFGQLQGKGQAIDFQAHDLYRIQDGRIAENWHLEDNLTLMQQLGAIPQ